MEVVNMNWTSQQGKVRVYDRDTKRWSVYRLPLVYKQLVQQAYEDGRRDRIPFVRV